MSDDADWRDVTPAFAGSEFEVQQHRKTGEARHRPRQDGNSESDMPWTPGWPGKGLQW